MEQDRIRRAAEEVAKNEKKEQERIAYENSTQFQVDQRNGDRISAREGIVGHGLGKANEVTTAIAKGMEDAKKNLIKVPIIKGTIPHEQYGKYGGAKVFIKPASSGTGVKAGGAMRAVLESVGVKDVLAKSKGSSNPHNLVKATFDALLELRDAKAVAKQRMVSLDKVFNG